MKPYCLPIGPFNDKGYKSHIYTKKNKGMAPSVNELEI